MKSLSGLGVGLSAVFGCLLLALLAELYYLLYCKNRISLQHNKVEQENVTSCCKNPTTTTTTTTSTDLVHDPQLQISHPNKPLSFPPRFLFTITEESREELESDDGVGKRDIHSPLFLTPVGSPPYYTPPLTPTIVHQGNNSPFVEVEREAEFNRMLTSSPPPKLKFLRDAEDKRRMKLMAQIDLVCVLENPPHR